MTSVFDKDDNNEKGMIKTFNSYVIKIKSEPIFIPRNGTSTSMQYDAIQRIKGVDSRLL